MSMNPRTRRSIVSAIAGAIILSAAASAFAFDIGSLLNNKPKDNFAIIRADQLASLMANPNSHVNIYDANGWGLRSTSGVIPGAHLLSSDDKYDVATTLPPEKNAKLVFYCADTQCTASHEAARRAMAAGYTDVSVMSDGIKGWVDAGKPVEHPKLEASNNS
ncbi:MAG TPA: rhodanese-like domain-containing protein [Candidatus Acidoferrales bacterium]|jgi:rhodanese-related sulfurtransferase|nr:rhodanese-like domain-containing protein [Candidatus Acidoferrales bacterium]